MVPLEIALVYREGSLAPSIATRFLHANQYTSFIASSIVFLGTSAFAVPSLRALAKDARFKVELVVTQPDRPVGRKQTLTPPPVKATAEELGLKTWQPENINTKFEIRNSKHEGPSNFELRASSFDFLVVVSYGQILSKNILDLPKIAPVNVHASLLPKFRGASPVQHAILKDERETGVTVQRMVEKLDAGPILAQRKISIDPKETFTTLHDKLAGVGAMLLVATLNSPLKEVPQDESKATTCRKLTREDGIVDPKTMTAEQIDRMARALTPWPGVNISNTKLLQTSLNPDPEALALPCKDGTTLYIVRIQPAAGKPMSGREFSRGRTLQS